MKLLGRCLARTRTPSFLPPLGQHLLSSPPQQQRLALAIAPNMPAGVKRRSTAASTTDENAAPSKRYRKNTAAAATAAASADLPMAPSADDIDVDHNPLWKVSPKRGVTVSRFGRDKTVFINIREFYDKNKDGQKHAGKGISLPVEQWNDLLKVIPHINEYLEALGETVGPKEGEEGKIKEEKEGEVKGEDEK